MTECQMIPFPLKARVGKVRRVAEVYQRKTGNDQAAYWRTEVQRLGDHLAELGFEYDLINSELGEFKRAVQSEIDRRHLDGRSGQSGNNPKGAA
ncbi:DUF6074 family protein [Rhizobium rhizogenes]|uniref:DUF6074 family protein n=1 Tax=Rhizobium rhizogenes TaxID=359 RepID=UPI0015749798|nr:DUF6074 family protein [Rhizobium rhizogenes]NTF43086.1 hypothetical protein [Rhizobium rhizogenes]